MSMAVPLAREMPRPRNWLEWALFRNHRPLLVMLANVRLMKFEWLVPLRMRPYCGSMTMFWRVTPVTSARFIAPYTSWPFPSRVMLSAEMMMAVGLVRAVSSDKR